MKLLLLLLGCIAVAQCRAQATFEIVNQRVEVGETPYDSLQVSGICYYTNQGDAPLYLTSAITFCPCTKVEYPKEPLAPGDTAQITITHHMKGLGPFNEAARISYFHPDVDDAAKYIFISGKAIREQKE